jgi:hypothetical protein
MYLGLNIANILFFKMMFMIFCCVVEHAGGSVLCDKNDLEDRKVVIGSKPPVCVNRDVNGAGNVRRKLSPFPAPNCFRGNFCLHPRPHGGIFIPIPTDPHGSRGDPRVSNINKKLYFSVKIMIVV